MAISFRISSFSFDLIDFMKGKGGSKDHCPKQPPIETPPIINDQDQTDFLFDQLSGVISADKQMNPNESPAVLVREVESSEAEPIKETEDNNKRGRGKHRELSDIDKINRDIRRKFRHEYREVKNAYATNISYQLSHKDMIDSQIQMNRFHNNNSNLQNDNERYYEKEMQEKADIKEEDEK